VLRASWAKVASNMSSTVLSSGRGASCHHARRRHMDAARFFVCLLTRSPDRELRTTRAKMEHQIPRHAVGRASGRRFLYVSTCKFVSVCVWQTELQGLTLVSVSSCVCAHACMHPETPPHLAPLFVECVLLFHGSPGGYCMWYACDRCCECHADVKPFGQH
jgi:hypothetical protein